MNQILRLRVATLTIAFALLASPAAFATQTEIKMATLAPKGTAMSNVFENAVELVEKNTNNEVKIRFYYGGMQGDEKEMLQKIRIRQLHGGAFTFMGLWRIVPEVHLLSLPYMYKNYEEYAYVREGLQADLEKLFEKKGYAVIVWGDSGFAYTFSKVPLTSPDVIKSQKFWLWGDDPIASAVYKARGITPVSLSIMDVMTSLSANLIDVVANTPAMAIAFRWHTRFKYMDEYPSLIAGGATIVLKSQWEKIPEQHRKTIRDIIKPRYDSYVETLRKDDEKAIGLLKKAGLKVVRMSENPKAEQMNEEVAKKVRESLVGKLYSRELLDKALRLRDEYRKKNPNAKAVKIP